jgi:ABC-type uncharacterized transport system permease subunit
MIPNPFAVASALAYLGAAALLWRTLAARDGSRPIAALGTGAAAVVLHAAALAGALHRHEGLVLSVQHTLSLLAWEAAVLTLLAMLRPAAAPLGLVAMPIGAVAALLLVGGGEGVGVTQLTPAVRTHVLLSSMAYGVLMLAAGQALLLWYQERRLRARDVQGLIGLLPPLALMEALLFEMLAAGVVLLTLALASGFAFVFDIRAQHLVHKTVLSVLAWTILAVLLWGRWRHGWRGPRAVGLTLAGFATLVVAYFGSRFVLEVLLGRSWS